MKKIKAIIIALAMALAAVLCGSCSSQADELVQFLNERVEQVGEGITTLIRNLIKKNDQVDELVRCLNDHDEEGIMNLFCEKTRTANDIDFEQQISDVFNLFGDKTITSYDWKGGGDEASWEKGKKTWHWMAIFIEKIELSDGSDNIDMIVFSKILACEEGPDRVGLEWIKIITDDEEEYRIGEPKVE